MSTENENKPEGTTGNDERQNVSREGGYRSYNRYNSDSSQRSYRPRTNSYNRDGGDRQYRPSYNNRYNSYGNNGDRPQRPRFNNNNEENNGEQRSYRPRTNNYNREDGEQRSYRPRTNNYSREGGDRPYNGGERPYNNGERSYNSGERPYNGGERSYNGGERPYNSRPSYNRYDNNSDRPQRPRSYGQNNRYDNGGGIDRPYRPRFTPGGYQNNSGRGRSYSTGYNPNAKYSMKKQIEYKDILTDPNEPIRLNKFLANAGICSRREADEYITAGVVSVNGEVVSELGTKIKRTDEVKFHDESVKIEKKVYVLLNKPKDCVTTSDDPQERKTVMDYVKDACNERIYPVGRLDRNTTGVLLLTNDGDLASKLTHPKFMKKKIYHVYCDKNVSKADLDQILEGITLEDGEIHADEINYASDTDKSQIGIEIHSGKNRIVRRIFESLGYKVIKLDRVYFAGLTKKGLRRGDWRYLTEQEVNVLRMGSFE